MQKFKKAVGLLQEEAPDNHFLAYINPKEAGLLKLAGGSGKMTPQGILSFEDDDPGDTFSGSSNDNSGSSYDEAGVDSYTNNSYSGGSPAYSGGGYNETTTTTTDDSQDDDKALSYVNWNEPVTSPENVSEDSNVSLLSNLFKAAKVPYDLLKGNIPTSLLSLVNPFKFSEDENQYAGIEGEDGYGEGDYNKNRDVFETLEEFSPGYSNLDQEEQALVDKQFFDDGYRTKDFRNFYSGESTDTSKFTQPESEVYNKLIPYAPFIASGTEAPQQSMVNDYFANLGSQTSLSSQLETDYNAAKASVAQAMAMNPLANQFGYSQTPYGGLTATNLDTNPFNIPYLQTRGLI
jgi:hypothetical protein